MEQPDYAIDVRTILDDLGEAIPIDAAVELPVIAIGTETFAPRRPARLVAQVTNTGAGIVASGTLDAEFDAVCSRCLREFPLSVITNVDGFYVEHGREYDLPEEQEVEYITEGSIDLMGQIMTALVLDLPFAPLHAEDCPGICPRCGADLVAAACACEPDRGDSPFAVLKELLPPEESV